MRVAVVGAGIGGLAVACGLSRGGAEVTVFEARPTPDAEGVALSLFDNGLVALDLLGTGDAVRALSLDQVPDLPAGLRDQRGRWLSRTGPRALASAHVVTRRELHSVLRAPIEDAICAGLRVDEVSDDGRVRLGDGETLPPCDLVVAADGLRSRVRAGLPGDPGVRYSGYYAWRGVTRHPVDHGFVQGLGELWGRGRRFGLAPLRSGHFYWFATAAASWDAPPAPTLAAVRQHFRGWHGDVTTMLDAADPDQVSCLPICALPAPPPSLTRGRTVLLGDAAHAMTPDLGQGANQALEDAAQLVFSLGSLVSQGRPDPAAVTAALRHYDAARRPRAGRLITGSRQMGRIGQLRAAPAVATRNAVLRLTPTAMTDRAALSVQMWAPR